MRGSFSPIIQEEPLRKTSLTLSKKLWAEDEHGKIQARRRNFQKFRSK